MTPNTQYPCEYIMLNCNYLQLSSLVFFLSNPIPVFVQSVVFKPLWNIENKLCTLLVFSNEKTIAFAPTGSSLVRSVSETTMYHVKCEIVRNYLDVSFITDNIQQDWFAIIWNGDDSQNKNELDIRPSVSVCSFTFMGRHEFEMHMSRHSIPTTCVDNIVVRYNIVLNFHPGLY